MELAPLERGKKKPRGSAPKSHPSKRTVRMHDRIVLGYDRDKGRTDDDYRERRVKRRRLVRKSEVEVEGGRG